MNFPPQFTKSNFPLCAREISEGTGCSADCLGLFVSLVDGRLLRSVCWLSPFPLFNCCICCICMEVYYCHHRDASLNRKLSRDRLRLICLRSKIRKTIIVLFIILCVCIPFPILDRFEFPSHLFIT